MKSYAQLNITKRNLGELKPHPRNPRQHPDSQKRALAASIERFSYAKGSICVQRDTNLIIAGHAIRDALMEKGFIEADVIELDFNDDDALAFLTADNQYALLAEWNDDQLQANLDRLKELNFKMPDLGFEMPDMNFIDKEETFDVAEAMEEEYEPITQTGDIWLCGKHRVMCGNSAEREDIERLMNCEKADLFLTDPPYGVSYAEKNAFLNEFDEGKRIQEPIERDHQSLDELYPFWKIVCEYAYLFTSDKASYYWFACQGGDQMMMMMMSINNAKWKVRHELIWVKNNHVLGRTDYQYKHEPILFGWKQDGSHNFYGGFQTSVLEFDKPLKSNLHPTMKPVELIELLIRNSSQKDEIILDPFLGSGTTLIACEKTGRICYGMEISPRYCDVICRRYYDFTGDVPVNEATKEPFPIQEE